MSFKLYIFINKHTPLYASIPSYLLNDIWALEMLKYADFIQVALHSAFVENSLLNENLKTLWFPCKLKFINNPYSYISFIDRNNYMDL